MASSPFPSRVASQIVIQGPFQWHLRDLAARSVRQDLRGLDQMDGRLEGFVDALVQLNAGELAKHQSVLNYKTPGGVFALAMYSVRNRDAKLLLPLIEEAASEPPAFRQFVSALAWLQAEEAEPIIARMLETSTPDFQALGLAAAAARRRDPGPVLAEALEHEDAGLRMQALRAALKLGRHDLCSLLPAAFSAPEEGVRFHAAAASVVWGKTEGAQVLMSIADDVGPQAPLAAWFATLALDPHVWAEWMEVNSNKPNWFPCAAHSCSASGNVRSVPWLLEALTDPQRNRTAGEAFCTLTGASPETLEPDVKSGSALEDLPQIDAHKATLWWYHHANLFSSAQPYFLGSPRDARTLDWALRLANQKRRLEAAILSAATHPGEPMFETAAPAANQKKLLGVAL